MTSAPLIDQEMEATLIGAVLSNPKLAKEATFLHPDDFAYTLHQTVWREIQGRYDRGDTFSPLVIAQALETDLSEVGGAKFLARLMSFAFGRPDIQAWGRDLKDLSMKRSAIRIMDDAAQRLNDTSEQATAEEQIADTLVLLERAMRSGLSKIQTDREVREQEVDNLKKPAVVYSTGFGALDDAMGGGIHKAKAYGFAGRMKSGKTLLGSQISHSLNQQQIKHAYFACEMGSAQIEHRAMASEIGLNSLAFLDERMRHNEAFISSAGSAAVTSPGNILYRDSPGLTFEQMRRDVTHAILGRGAQGFVIDYLQLVGGKRKGQSTAEHLDEMCQWIAETCYKRGVFAIVLCQLNQEGNVRGGEGIKLAFDQVYELRRTEEGSGNEAWLEMMATRYTKWGSVGSEMSPAFMLNTSVGPRFEELGGGNRVD